MGISGPFKGWPHKLLIQHLAQLRSKEDLFPMEELSAPPPVDVVIKLWNSLAQAAVDARRSRRFKWRLDRYTEGKSTKVYLIQRGNTSGSAKSLRDKLFKADIWRKYLPSLLILLPRHQLLATAGGGIWVKKDICFLVAQPLLWSRTSSGSHPLLTSIPLTHRRFFTTSAELHAEWWTTELWLRQWAWQLREEVVETSSIKI